MAAEKKLTDADVMTGFNPVRDLPAEEVEAQQTDAEPVQASESEGESAGDEASTASSFVDVKLDGRVVKAPKDVAEAFTREINRRDGTRGAELQTLRERLARLEGAAAATTRPNEPEVPAGPPLPTPELQIENPAEYQKQMLAYIAHQQQAQTEALANQYQEAEAAKEQESARRARWAEHCNAFYSKPENAVLRDNKDIVDLVLDAHKDELAPLSVEEGFNRLAELTKERLGRVTGAAPELRGRRAAKPPTLEGSARRDSAVTPPAEAKGPTSLTQALKERRKQAAEAYSKGGQGRPQTSR